MHPDHEEGVRGTTQESRFVSGRFLSDLFRTLERHGISAIGLLGDLPISLGDRGQVRGSVEWDHFSDFMCRLERQVGGPSGLENCGEMTGRLAPAGALVGLAGYAASPYTLYRAACQWALRRALPGIEARLTRVDAGHLEIEARLAEGLRACPQIFHFATGGARILPRLIGLADAVVSASISDREAHYRITVPPSMSLLARVKRLSRTIFSGGSMLHYLEAQQLELHAMNEALQSAQEALAASERRFRTITETAVDVLCEIDELGRIVYVSGSIRHLMGYSPEQVTNSHYRLWIDREQHKRVEKAFNSLLSQPRGRSTRECVRLHTDHGDKIDADVTARSYETSEGARRIECILRDMSDRPASPFARSGVRLGARSRKHPRRSSETSRRVTRIAESVLAGTNDTEMGFQWIETRKLLRDVRDSFGTKAGTDGIDLRIDLSNAPSEIFTDETLLNTALASLLDSVADPAHPTSAKESMRTVRVTVDTRTDGTTKDRVVFLVGPVCESRERPKQGWPEHVVNAGSEIGGVEIAADAVEHLGGRLSGGDRDGDGADASAWSIELSQPARPSRSA